MVPRWFLGAVSAAGLATGFSVSAYASSTPKAHAATGYADVERLYHNEVALSTKEQQLQFLLKLRTEQQFLLTLNAHQAGATARPTTTAQPQSAAAPSGSPTTPPSSPPHAPSTTTTIVATTPPPESEPTPTTTTPPPPTTTTSTVVPTTTTTTWRDDSGGGDN